MKLLSSVARGALAATALLAVSGLVGLSVALARAIWNGREIAFDFSLPDWKKLAFVWLLTFFMTFAFEAFRQHSRNGTRSSDSSSH